MSFSSVSSTTVDLPTIFRSRQPAIEHRLHEALPEYVTRIDSDLATETNFVLRSLLEKPTSKTSLETVVFDRQSIILWLRLALALSSSVRRERSVMGSEAELPAQQQLVLDQAVVAEYAAIPQVALIYSDRYLAEHVFTILVTGNQYDDAVMDILLDREIGLLNRFAPTPLAFYYFPYSPSSPRREMVRETARLIFGG